MPDVIGALRVLMSIDTAEYVKGLRTAEKGAEKTAKTIKKSFTGLEPWKTGLASGLGIAALTRVTTRALDYAASLKDVSQQLGVTTRDLQTFRYAASQSNITQAELDAGLAALTTTLGKVAAGAKAPIAALEALKKGLSKEVLGKSTGDALRLISDGLKNIPDRMQRAAIETALFTKAGVKLDTMLAGGSARLGELASAAERLGVVLSDQQIQKADETANKLSDLKQVLEARIAGTVADNANSILSLANALSNLANSVLEFLAANPVKAASILGALGGGMVGGVVGAAAGALGAAGYASNHTEEGLRNNLKYLLHARRLYYVASGGTQAELDSGKLNPAIVAKIKGKSGFKDYNEQIAATRAELANLTGGGSIAAPTDAPGNGSVGNFLAPAPRKPRKGRKGKSPEQAEYEYERELNRSRQDIAAAHADLADTAIERDQFERIRLTLAHEQVVADIKNDKDLTEERRKVLLAYEDQNFDLAADKINKRENIRIEQEQANIVMDRLRLEQEILSGQANLVDTQAERRRIELKILDAKYEELRQSLRQVTARNGASPDQIADAQDRLAKLGEMKANEAASIRRGTMGPLEAYLDSLPSTAARANEAFEAVAAGGISSIVDGLADAAVGARSLADVFSNVAKQIISDLIRIQIQKAIVGALSSALGGGFNSSLNATISSNNAALSSGLSGAEMPGFATGGEFTIQGRRGYDTNLLSLNGVGIARVSHGERVAISPDNDNRDAQGMNITVTPSPLFDVKIQQVGVQAQVGGASLAMTQIAKRRARSLT